MELRGSQDEPDHRSVDVLFEDQFSWSGQATAVVGALLGVGFAGILLEQLFDTSLISSENATRLGSLVDAMALGIALLTFAALSSRNRAAPDRLNLATTSILAVLAAVVLPLDLVPQVANATSTVALAIATRVVIVTLPLMVKFRQSSATQVPLPQLVAVVLFSTMTLALGLDFAIRLGGFDQKEMLGVALGTCAVLAVLGALRLGVLSLRHHEPRGYILALTLVALGVADGYASLVETGSLSSTAGKAMRLVVISAILVYTVIELRDLALRDRERALRAQGESERAADRLVAEMSFQERFVHDARNALLAIQGGLKSLESEEDVMVAALASEVERLRILLEGDDRDPLPATFDLVHALSPMISCYEAAGSQIKLIASGPMIVRGRPSIAAEVTQNLIENARVYGGESEIIVWIFERPDCVEVRVADRGDGVEIDLRESIFEHGRSGGQSSGVGLHISRRLIEQQGGTLDVSGRHGGGSIFAFTLPRAENPQATGAFEGRLSA